MTAYVAQPRRRGDNSFFREDKANITLGKGGVDDAEDAEVIVHEYGHSVQDAQVPGFGTTLESGAIGEAFSDYLAVVTNWKTGAPTRTPEACFADWTRRQAVTRLDKARSIITIAVRCRSACSPERGRVALIRWHRARE